MYRLITNSEFDSFNKKSPYGKLYLSEDGLGEDNDLFRYKFSFSISKNNIEKFNKMLDTFLGEGFTIGNSNKVITFDKNALLKDVNSFLKRENHFINKIEYVRYNYNFYSKEATLFKVFIISVRDVIDIIGKYYGFDESGNEISTLKYKVGEIVCIKNDKNRKDYIIESFLFQRQKTIDKESKEDIDPNDLVIYELLEIKHNNNYQAIEYGEYQRVKSSDIIPNRKARIDNILN